MNTAGDNNLNSCEYICSNSEIFNEIGYSLQFISDAGSSLLDLLVVKHFDMIYYPFIPVKMFLHRVFHNYKEDDDINTYKMKLDIIKCLRDLYPRIEEDDVICIINKNHMKFNDYHDLNLFRNKDYIEKEIDTYILDIQDGFNKKRSCRQVVLGTDKIGYDYYI